MGMKEGGTRRVTGDWQTVQTVLLAQFVELELAIDHGCLTSCKVAEGMAGFPRNVIISWEPFQF